MIKYMVYILYLYIFDEIVAWIRTYTLKFHEIMSRKIYVYVIIDRESNKWHRSKRFPSHPDER